MTYVQASDARVVEVVRRPYLRLVELDSDGYYTASIAEFPGCAASAPTAEDAVRALGELFPEFVATRLSEGQSIPNRSNWASTQAASPCGSHRRCTKRPRAGLRSKVSA